MARRNLFEKLSNPKSDISLRPFDLSRRNVYSARAGMCLPTLCMETVKGDKFKINTTVFNRTTRLIAPPFFRCKQFNHFFFVPYNTLWHEFDAFLTRSTEKESAASLGSNYFPNFCFQDFMSSIQSGDTDMLGYKALPGIDRMMQFFGMSGVEGFDGQYTVDEKKYFNLARPLAYNKIWYWFYRDKRHYPTATWFQDFVQYYNVDDINCNTFENSHVSTDTKRLVRMFMPKYRTWDSDLFTNSFNDTQFGNISVVNADNVIIKNALDTSGISASSISISISKSTVTSPDANLAMRDSSGTLMSGSTRWNIPSLFDVISLRRAEAVQHWRELMLRAGDSSKDRYRAMFGSNPKRSDEVPTYIGGFDVNLNIDDVTSTVGDAVQGSQLGDLAGKGIMVSDGNEVTFTSPDYGIIMCITTFLPMTEYDATQVDKANMLIEPTDFYIPQFDRLGFEPIIRAEFACNTGEDPILASDWTDVLGYTVRNHYLKTAVDRVYGNFRSGKNENYWTCVRTPIFTANLGNVSSFRNFYCDPANLNAMFDRKVLTNTENCDSSYSQDHFRCMIYFDIKALRPMSELGLPPL